MAETKEESLQRLKNYINNMSEEQKQAHKERIRQNYHKNKDRYTETKKKRIDLCLSMVESYKLSNPCAHCGESNPIVLDFHHVNPNEKEFNIAQYANQGYPMSKIEAEIKKCIVLCSNCHRIEHHRLRNL